MMEIPDLGLRKVRFPHPGLQHEAYNRQTASHNDRGCGVRLGEIMHTMACYQLCG
jgi:hypothetical protein